MAPGPQLSTSFENMTHHDQKGGQEAPHLQPLFLSVPFSSPQFQSPSQCLLLLKAAKMFLPGHLPYVLGLSLSSKRTHMASGPPLLGIS